MGDSALTPRSLLVAVVDDLLTDSSILSSTGVGVLGGVSNTSLDVDDDRPFMEDLDELFCSLNSSSLYDLRVRLSLDRSEP